MQNEKENKTSVVESDENHYELRAPDGGWGYVIVGAFVVIFCVTIIPLSAFGLIYGGFLSKVGDETTGTTLGNAMFNTVNSFAGLLANGLLNRYSHRIVAVLGCTLFILGATALIFSQTQFQFFMCFGVIEGIGAGILIPAIMSSFNSYFDEKMNVMMGISQALMVAFNIAVPQMAAWSIKTYGYRGTLIGLAVMASLSLPAVATLQPVQRNMKKVYLKTINSTVISIDKSNDLKKTLSKDSISGQIEPLLDTPEDLSLSQKTLHSIAHHVHNKIPRRSVVSLGDRIVSTATINEISDNDDEKLSIWKSVLKSIDVSLLKEGKYINISIGLALCFTGDIAFISIVPLMLGNIGFTSQDIAVMMAVFFGSDLVSRILLTILSYVISFRNRLLILFASVLIVVARTALVSNDSYMWKLVFLGVLGFLRCFIQTPQPLVLSDEYSNKFSSAFSLLMAVTGVVSLVVGSLMSLVKSYTQSDVMVCHLLTLAYIICVISWTAELTFCRKNTKSKEQR